MRKVVAYHFVSLDGVAEDPRRFVTGGDDLVDVNGAELIATQDAVILGRTSYEEWAQFWPESDVEPFATFINSVTKYVATSTPLTPAWANSIAIEGELSEFVASLKDQPGGDIGVHASISVVRHLLNAGLIDQLGLAVAPSVARTGRRLLDDVGPVRFSLSRATATPSGYLLADYEVLSSTAS